MTRLKTILRALCLLAPLVGATPAWAQPQTTFATAEEAVAALLTSLRAGNPSQIIAVLGPGSEALVESGDRYADAEARKHFIESYQQQHKLTATAPDRMTLEVGNDAWPLPTPIVQAGGRWHFDSAAGAQELVNRRIGRNEIAAIRTALAYVDAQALYRVLSGATGGRATYAQRMVSAPGKRDGLYWPGSPDAPDASPLAQVVADARENGYPGTLSAGKQMPYQGYYFRILKAQGRSAPGGPRNYVVNGRMTDGFGLVAWPATYGASGVMSFVVNQDGTVYQKDLGPETARIAGAMTLFDPDISWARVDITN